MGSDNGLLAQLFKLSWLSNILWGGTGILTCVLGALYVYQDNLLYHPVIPGVPKSPKENPKGYRSPGEYGINDYEEHMIKTDDGATVSAWLMLQATGSRKAPTVVYFHGNAGNMGFRLSHGVNLYKALNANVMLVDYRGYGDGVGKPTEVGLIKDGEAVLDTLKKHEKIDRSKIILYGKSLGGAVSLALAEKHPDDIMALVLENTFLSIPAMVDVLMPYVRLFKALVLRIGWHSDQRIQNVRHPILFISGLADELVPPEHMARLYKLARKSKLKELFTVSSGTHNDTMIKGGVSYLVKWREFVDKVLGVPGTGTGGSVEAVCKDEIVGEEGAIPTMPSYVPGGGKEY